MPSTSRYQDTPAFVDTSGGGGFRGLRPRFPPPATAVLEHTLTAMDRLDLLAQHYYNDSRLWWRILDANPELLCGADLSDPERVGTVILIPAAREPGSRA